MNDGPSILLRDKLAAWGKPSCMPQELVPLPHRVLFQNEFIGVVLVGLKQGHELLFNKTSRLLVTVAYGRAQIIFGRRFLTLREGGQHRVEMSEGCELRALLETDLLLFVPTERAASF